MRFAAVQMSSQADLASNLSAAEREVERAKQGNAEVVVLPEAFAFLGPESDKAALAEGLCLEELCLDELGPGELGRGELGRGELGRGEGAPEAAADGPIVAALRRWSRDFDLVVIGAGFPELSPDPARPYNTSAVFSRGALISRYRKVHLFDVDLSDGTKLSESQGTSAGDAPAVVALDGVKLGLSICYDLRFPELFALERAAGADVFVLGAAFTKTTGAAHWHTLLRARAIETQSYVVAAAQFGEHPRGRRTFGHSLIIDPWGEILAELPDGPGVVLADVDPLRVKSVRAQMPLEQHRVLFRA